MAMKVLAHHPMPDEEADTQLLALQTKSEIEGKNLIVMRNLQFQIDSLTARVVILETP